MSEATNQIPASPLAPLMVQMLYHSEPVIDLEQLTAKVEEYCGRTDPAHRPAADAEMAQYLMIDAEAQYKEGRLPTQLCLCRAGAPPDAARFEKALQQTWDWAEARSVVASTRYMLLANDLSAAALDRKLRNKQFRGFIRAVQEVVPCLAMHWMNTQLMVNPGRFVFRQGEDGVQPLYGSINVRLFTIQGTSGDCLMDTMGLATLGLPDIQCHYRELHSPDVAQLLYNTACYVFDCGDVIKDGETVPGVLENDRWKCQHEMALVGPERVVLDLDPGDHYAAGGRNR